MEPKMAEDQAGGSKPFDPLESFRGLRDIYLDTMAKAMVEAVNTESYAKASGAMLDTTLTMSAPLRDGLEKSMLQVLEQLSLPSRQDIVALAERFTNLEMRLDDMDAKLDRILGLSHAAQQGVPAGTVAEPVSRTTPTTKAGPTKTVPAKQVNAHKPAAAPKKTAPSRKAARNRAK
jgi:polyhydroxyalkanoate synthesis regulator phasin